MIISSHGKSQRSGRTLRTWSAMERYKQWPWCVVCDVQTNEEPFGIGHFPSSSWHATIYELRFYYSSLHIQRQQEFVFLSRVSTSAQHTISILVWTLECQVLHQASFEKDNLSEKNNLSTIHSPSSLQKQLFDTSVVSSLCLTSKHFGFVSKWWCGCWHFWDSSILRHSPSDKYLVNQSNSPNTPFSLG